MAFIYAFPGQCYKKNCECNINKLYHGYYLSLKVYKGNSSYVSLALGNLSDVNKRLKEITKRWPIQNRKQVERGIKRLLYKLEKLNKNPKAISEKIPNFNKKLLLDTKY